MAKTNLYSMYDKEAETVVGPIVAELRHAPAIRTFGELCADKNTVVGKYAEQFQLRFVGTQNLETGEITPVTIHPGYEIIATGAEWLAAQRRAALNPETTTDDGPKH